MKNKSKFISVQLNDLYKNGIYHSKTFLILNKIFSKTKINFKLIEIPINLFVWLMVIFLITYLISKKQNNKKFYLISFLYCGFILSYFIFLIIWALKNNLINEDFSLAISWQRHLGTLILGYIIFIFINSLKYFKNYYLLIGIFLISITISPANAIRIFLPSEILMQDKFWSSKYFQRLEINKLSNKIKNELNDYNHLLIDLHNSEDPYFLEILKYELIKINITSMNIQKKTTDELNYSPQFILNKFDFNKSKLNILTSKLYDEDMIIKKIKKVNQTPIVINSKNLLNEFNYYEISLNQDQKDK